MDPLTNPPERLFSDTQWLQRLARQLLRDPDAADDLTQDTWLDVLRHRGAAVRNRRAWLRRLLYHRFVSGRRSEAARATREQASARTEALPSTAELCERAELQRVMGEALLELEEPYRTTALLRFLEGLSPAEIATRQAVPVNTVRWRLRRAIAALRERLDRDVGKHWGLALLAFADPKRDVLTAGASQVTAVLGTTLMIKKALLIGAALAALSILAVYVFDGPADPEALTTFGRDRSEPLVDSSSETQAANSESARRILPASEEPGSVASAVATSATPMATILFEAVSREQARPLAGVAAMPEVRGRAIVEYAVSQTRLSDAAGELRYEVPAGEVVHVQAWGEDPPAGLAVLDVGPLEAGEERRVRLELPTTVDITFFGRLVDEESGEPLAGVDIVPQLRSRLAAAVEEARSDAEGIFELRVPSWRYAHFNATLEGYGRIVFDPRVGHETRAEALDLELPHAAAVEGQVEAGQLAAGEAQVVFEASGRGVQRPRDGGSRRFSRESWRAQVEANGSYRIEGLNAGARYQAQLLVAGEVVREHPSEIVLEAGETRRLDWGSGLGATLAGELVDQAGEAVTEVELWLAPTRWIQDRHFHSNDGRGALRARTDARGHFRFEDVSAGRWLIGPGIAKEGPGRHVASWAVTLELEPGVGCHDLRLETWRDLALRGRVLDPEGAPAPRCSVTLDATDGARRRVKTDESGHFEALGLRALEYTLSAGGMGEGYARSASLTLEPGDGEVELLLGPSGSIRGRVRGSKQMSNLGTVLISAREPKNPDDDWMSIGVRVDGYFGIDGLTPGIYDVYAHRRDGRCVLVAGHRVEAGPATEPLELELLEGAWLSPRLGAGVKRASYELFVEGALVDFGNCDSEGGQTHLVPAGRVEVRFETDAGIEGSTTVDLESGARREIELR